jgi:ribulose-5-phosphate 4-epimerase/fuculose-1-phosphate aldolase
MNEMDQARRDLVIANRILAREDVVDAYGHVSMRHPQDPGRYLLSWSRSPELVEGGDIVEFTLDGKPVKDDGRPPYLERFIHGAIYEARPEVQAVIHSHAEDLLPYGVTHAKMPPVIHSGSVIGTEVPVWDIADQFGKSTNLLVRNMDQGRDLAKRLAGNRLVLMRGHGFAAAGRSLMDAVRIGVYAPKNARVHMAALRLGEPIIPLHPGEIEARTDLFNPNTAEMWRAWEYWARRASVADLLGEPPKAAKGSGG